MFDFELDENDPDNDEGKKPHFLIEVSLPDAAAQQELMQSLERRGFKCWALTMPRET